MEKEKTRHEREKCRMHICMEKDNGQNVVEFVFPFNHFKSFLS